MSKSDFLTAFNNQLTELIEELIKVISDNQELKTAHASILSLRKMNPKIIIPIWKVYVLDNYEQQIEKGDIEYFLEKDYKEDVKNQGNASEILYKIEVIKNNIKNLDDSNRSKTVLYIQNLTKLCKLYFNS